MACMLARVQRSWKMVGWAITLRGVQTAKLVLVNRMPDTLRMEHGCQRELLRIQLNLVLHLHRNLQ